MHTSFSPAIRSISQGLVNTTDGSTIGTVLSVPWIDKNYTDRIKIVTHRLIFYNCLRSGAVGVLLNS